MRGAGAGECPHPRDRRGGTRTGVAYSADGRPCHADGRRSAPSQGSKEGGRMKETCKTTRMPALILAAAALLLCSQPAFAVRLARFTVAVDDKVVLETSTSDPGGD